MLADASAHVAKEKNRHYDHGQLRLVTPKMEKGKIVLWWWVPSGQRLIFVPRYNHPGWIARLRRAIRDNVRYVVVGGHYFQTNASGGWVRPTLVKRVRRVFRGVRPVKFDGRMPLYQATVLPRQTGDRLYVYKLWGRVYLHQQRYNNQIVCLFGDWFDFQTGGLGLVNQVEGLKGPSLHQFPAQYRYSLDWGKLWHRRDILVNYQENRRLQRPATFPVRDVPIFSRTETLRTHHHCRQQMTPLERTMSTPVDHLYELEQFEAMFFPFPIPLQFFALPGTFRTQAPEYYWSHGIVRIRDMY